jgi:AmmeMemoRadiSam system protein B
MKSAALRNYRKSKVLKRTDSGDVTGDKSEVVGYLSAVVYS